jgi:transposase
MEQFAPMLEQFAPMLEQMAPLIQKMQARVGKKRMARLVQMAEPLMSMMPGGGGSALGVDGLASVSSDARGRHARRHK